MSELIRPKNGRQTMSRLLVYFRPHLPGLLAVFLLVAMSTACSLTVPFLIGRAIDAAGGGIQLSPWLLIVGLGAVYALDALVSWIQARLMAGISQSLVRDLRLSLFAALVQLPLAVFDRRDHGDLMSRMSNDSDNVALGLAQSGAQLMGALLGVAGSLACMLALSPLLTLAALVTVPLVFLLTRVVSKRTRDNFRDQQIALGALNAHLEESVNGFLEVKVFDRESAVISRFDELNERLRHSGTKAQIWAGFVMPLMNVINNFGFAVLAGVGGWLSIGGVVTVGLIASFVGYSRQFGRPLNEIANTWNTLQAAIAGAERVFEILDETPEPADLPQARPLVGPRGEVEFDQVQFGYVSGQPVLQNFSVRVPAGSVIALVGPTGSGKTTVISLLLRFYDPGAGRILLDGLDIRDWQRSSLRRAFGVVLQDTWLFEGTVADNIRYARPEASQAEVELAARSANAAEFIQRLPQGYETVLKNQAGNLSQGQRQLIAIARAVLADAPCLILDEATSNIDTRTEFRVQEAMIQLMKGRTCFIIAHRLSTIRDASRIILIDKGGILESGSHDELLAQGGSYAAMYHSTLRPSGVAGA